MGDIHTMRLSIIQNYLKTHKIRNTKIIHAFKQFEISQINTIIDEKRERERERKKEETRDCLQNMSGSS